MILKDLFGGVFQNKKIFVTGHTGFQGSWLTLWLKSLGAKVTGYSLLPPTKPSLFEILQLKQDINHIVGDVRDHSFLQKCLIKHKPDIVFHLAAQPLVRLSYEKPVDTFHTNIMGTVNLLEAIRNTQSVKAGIIITSDKCYENKEWGFAYRENDPLGGFDPYSASKGATEIVTSSYSRSFFHSNNKKRKIGIATVRAGNVIGGGDWAQDRIVPDCIRSIYSGKQILIRNPKSIRPWQHVLEPISGMLLLASKLWDNPHSYNESWNFGPNLSTNVTVKELVIQIIKELKQKPNWKDVSKNTKSAVHEANFLRLDSTKANNLLGWRQTYDNKETISETTSWYQNYIKKTEMKKFTLLQIKKYVEKAKHMNAAWAVNK
jgi:CDP-glucose 4,6-dehydratase